MLQPGEARALDTLDGEAAAMVGQVERWAAINSGSGNLEGLARMADALADEFAAVGEVELVPSPPSEAVDAAGASVAVAHGRHLRMVVNPQAPVRVLMTGHMDTVYAADHPFQACRWLDAGRLNGPGVADMKGGLAILLAGLQAALRAGAELGVEVIINSDEEVSSPGSRALLAEAAARAHWGLTYEPSLADGTLAGARWGSGNFAAVVRGRAAHAGRNPEEGRNALVAAAALALALAGRGGPDLRVNPARIEGGGPNNIVPDRAVLRFNMRPRTPEAQAAAEAALARAVEGVVEGHGVEIALSGGFARPPKPLEPHLRLFELVRACGQDLGQPIAWGPTGGVCDGNNLGAAGLPVVDTLGARGGAIHSEAEYLLTDSLVERARLSALILMRLAEGRA